MIGVTRRNLDHETFRRNFGLAACKSGGGDANWLAERLYHLQGEFNNSAVYAESGEAPRRDRREASRRRGNYLFYLATPAQVFAAIVQHLGDAGLVREGEGYWRRVIIEKPFGFDLPSAQALDCEILGVLAERQIYRIDHYLGKETVQNILVFRFANGIFEPLWNRNHIDHVQITVAKSLDVEGRGRFYDATGALRDMVPNHLFQLLTLTAMEPPTCFDAEAVRSEKAKVLEGVRTLGCDATRDIVRGQYGAGTIDGKNIVPYRRAPDVAPDSVTETYVAFKIAIDSWRWAGVPFYLRTGKALAARRSEIAIQFKRAPFTMFRDTPVERLAPNDLILQFSPRKE